MPDVLGNSSFTQRERAIEGLMAVATLAASSDEAKSSGRGVTVIAAAISAMQDLGVTVAEIAAITLRSGLTTDNLNDETRSMLQAYSGGN